ncbi:cell shape determination protein CcmA [Candidatus Berkelbacteria bacterium CG08_land_8_20_14_0_20_39_8]|uniref:Cell shape determination protein CcmA n=1 Tax=Candidatus Berkelbacteria bacterium CG08_land_8_20_14_0_20_39_8 TaxID=1974511 RepID=A0A2M6YCI0_9BACT|nr:MAG: cell shape determination protein CcmA [Candidatus Berkelbacteria bacterium CG08_land_8_20_14_0_20_39_8]
MERRSMENVDTIIGLNVNLKGNLKNQGSIQVNGSVEGEIRSDDNVNVGETAVVKGPISAKVVEVSGTVKGIIEASEKLEINPTGKVIGDINVKSLIIKQGAIFVGKSAMPDQGGDIVEAKDQPADEKSDVDSDKSEGKVK